MIENKYQLEGIELRPEVKWFAEQMEKKLLANDHKGGWTECTLDSLFERIDEEYFELNMAWSEKESAEDFIGEAADVANFLMMVSDLYFRGHRGAEY